MAFWPQTGCCSEQAPDAGSGVDGGRRPAETQAAIAKASKALRQNRVLRFNNILDAAVAGFFLVLVAGIVVLSVREWMLLLGRRKPAVLRETEPVWLPDYAVSEGRPLRVAGVAALAFALAKELVGRGGAGASRSGRQRFASASRAKTAARRNCTEARRARRSVQVYLEVAERRFKGVRRCC